jgi:hypothetical protein
MKDADLVHPSFLIKWGQDRLEIFITAPPGVDRLFLWCTEYRLDRILKSFGLGPELWRSKY